MNLNCETILNLFTFKRKKILCQIKVNRKRQQFKTTCRCLSQEQWAIFDQELEKLVAASNKLGETGYKFNLNPLIEVKIQKSKLDFKYFYELLDTIDEFNKCGSADLYEKHLVLECCIDFQQEAPFRYSPESEEYEPKVSISPDALMCGSLPYEPYTPSKKNLAEYKANVTKNNDINYLESNEDTYSPKPLLEAGVNVPDFATLIPEYTPAPISDRRNREENSQLNGQKADDVKNTSKQYTRIECEYIPKSQVVTTHNAPIYIPTPIEERAQKLCNRYNIRAFRKRSKTLDVFSEQVNVNDKQQLKTTIMLQNYEGNTKCQPPKVLKKRSMTIDEIPIDEVSGASVYIPSTLDEKTFQSVSKANELKKGVEQHLSKRMQFSENIGHNQYSDRRVSIVTANDFSSAVDKFANPSASISKCGIIPERENHTAAINEVQATLTSLNTIQKSRENKPFLTIAERESSHGNFDLSSPTKSPQLSNAYSDRALKTASVGKSLPSTKIVNSSHVKSLASEKHFKIPPKTQRKQSDTKPEVCNRSEKCIRDKRLFDNLSFKGIHDQVSLNRDSKVHNYGTQAVLKMCRRSERSPNKPKRLIEEQFNSSNKTDLKNHKSSLKNKELFGTDDEDDNDDVTHKNISDNKIFSPIKRTLKLKDSSKKKRQKRDKNSEAGRETK